MLSIILKLCRKFSQKEKKRITEAPCLQKVSRVGVSVSVWTDFDMITVDLSKWLRFSYLVNFKNSFYGNRSILLLSLFDNNKMLLFPYNEFEKVAFQFHSWEFCNTRFWVSSKWIKDFITLNHKRTNDADEWAWSSKQKWSLF